ncbi:molecular chaperone DnaK (HSP70) [Allocatelliglobosispora scoriae]|uniref:Molecular chaperone DnaK (HSP70) n=1 Tax=Allocatelliglobosispora scoriae TaxID=643052 RepID=A0A841BKH9_9ACTN|nr:Hsp70 family protein [Allocatelliglobosispora scoriae]MBB5867262.1 molecular chaperone DnaK (HSP70) [Allocatelliglobosispora scoriae]
MAGYVFLSYSRKDRGYVSQLASYLGTAGVDAWFDPDIRFGSDFERIIRNKIDGCSVLLVAMTPDSAASEWVAREIAWAERQGKPIVPMLLAGEVFPRFARVNYYPCHGGAMPGQDLIEQLRAHVGMPDGDRLAELREAVAEAQSWKRIGALTLVERLLGSVREETRDAARTALVGLISDPDAEVTARALQLWHSRGLGDLPAQRQPPRPRTRSGRAVVGIDFGTTNSLVGFMEAGEVTLIPNAEGSVVTPSVVAFAPDGQILVGAAAKRQTAANPAGTFYSVKLKLGTAWSVERGGRRYTAEDLAAMILARLREDVESHLGPVVVQAVMTVPAYFSMVQRDALHAAATAADLHVLRILSEPTAAAVAYGLNRTAEATVLMLDLGGGTFDVSLTEIGDGLNEIKATAGDNSLGGDDWDQALVDYLLHHVRRQSGLDLAGDRSVLLRLKVAAEAAKIELSSAMSAEVHVPFLAAGTDGPVHLLTTVSRDEFESMTRPILDRCETLIRAVLQDAGIRMESVDHIILVGGATRMPAVGKLVARLTGKQPYRGIIPEGVATGAAIQAAILTGAVKDILLLDVTPMSFGIETSHGAREKIIERNTTIPTKRSELFTTTEDFQRATVVKFFQGENERAESHQLLAALELTGIASAPRGVAEIEVTVDIDANGIVFVSAKDLGTGLEDSATVNRQSVTAARGLRPRPGTVGLVSLDASDGQRARDVVAAAERGLQRLPEFNVPGFADAESRGPSGDPVLLQVRRWRPRNPTFRMREDEVDWARGLGSRYRLVLVRMSPDGSAHDTVRYVPDPLSELTRTPPVSGEFHVSWSDIWSRGRPPF